MGLIAFVQHIRRAARDEHVMGGTPDVGRHFFVCYKCRRVVYYWHCIAERAARGKRQGCWCGSGEVQPQILPTWKAAALVIWFFIWRRVILQRAIWDPRFPRQFS